MTDEVIEFRSPEEILAQTDPNIEDNKIFPILSELDPRLRAENKEFDFANPPIHPVRLARLLTRTMKEYNGIGLAAPQVGANYKVFVMGTGDLIYACFNPKIVEFGSIDNADREGCLSFPGMFMSISRPNSIRAIFTNEYGQEIDREMYGLTARCFQHEFDHLNGTCFTDKVGKLTLQMARERQRKLIKNAVRKYGRQNPK